MPTPAGGQIDSRRHSWELVVRHCPGQSELLETRQCQFARPHMAEQHRSSREASGQRRQRQGSGSHRRAGRQALHGPGQELDSRLLACRDSVHQRRTPCQAERSPGFGAYAYTDEAINQAYRAVGEITKSRSPVAELLNAQSEPLAGASGRPGERGSAVQLCFAPPAPAASCLQPDKRLPEHSPIRRHRRYRLVLSKKKR